MYIGIYGQLFKNPYIFGRPEQNLAQMKQKHCRACAHGELLARILASDPALVPDLARVSAPNLVLVPDLARISASDPVFVLDSRIPSSAEQLRPLPT